MTYVRSTKASSSAHFKDRKHAHSYGSLPLGIWSLLTLFVLAPFSSVFGWWTVYIFYTLALLGGFWSRYVRHGRFLPAWPAVLAASLLPLVGLTFIPDWSTLINACSLAYALISIVVSSSARPLSEANRIRIGRLFTYGCLIVNLGGSAVSVVLHSPFHLLEPMGHFRASHRFLILADENNVSLGHSALVFYTFVLCTLTASNLGAFGHYARIMLFSICAAATVLTGATVSFIADAICLVALIVELTWSPLRKPLYILLATAVVATSVIPNALTSVLSFVRFDVQGKSQSQYQVESAGGDVTAGRFELNRLLISRIIQSPVLGVGHSDTALRYGTEVLGVSRISAARVESPLILAAKYGLPLFAVLIALVLMPLRLLAATGPLRVLGFSTSVGVIVQSGGNGIAVAQDVGFFCLMSWTVLIASSAFFQNTRRGKFGKRLMRSTSSYYKETHCA